MAQDLKNLSWNSTTVDVVAVQVSVDATDRAGVSRADSAYLAGVLPKGAIIQNVYMDVTEAFDGTTPSLSVGIDGAFAKYFVDTPIATKGVSVSTLANDTKVEVPEELYLTLTNGASTKGSVTVYLVYIDTAARREIFTV